MDKISRLFLIITSLFLLWGQTPAMSDEITIVADEWCPYNCKENEQDVGIFLEVVRKIYEPMGYTITYKTMPWSRAIEDTRNGKFNAVIGAVHDEVPDFVFPIFPTIEVSTGFYTLPANPWTYKDAQGLQNISLGVIQDYLYNSDVNLYIKNNKDNFQRIQVVSGDNALSKNIQKLLHGRIDAIIEDKAVMAYYMKKFNLADQIRFAGETSREGLFVAFSPNVEESKTYSKIFDDGLSRLRRSGELKEIFSKYGVDPD